MTVESMLSTGKSIETMGAWLPKRGVEPWRLRVLNTITTTALLHLLVTPII